VRGVLITWPSAACTEGIFNFSLNGGLLLLGAAPVKSPGNRHLHRQSILKVSVTLCFFMRNTVLFGFWHNMGLPSGLPGMLLLSAKGKLTL
jgi:hypothetical protein